MILRPARADDAAVFEAFDLGDHSEPSLAEVAEIVGGLWGWVNDPAASEQDRVVLVAEEQGQLVGVVAHHLLLDERGDVIDGHRYLMVTAIQRRYRHSPADHRPRPPSHFRHPRPRRGVSQRDLMASTGHTDPSMIGYYDRARASIERNCTHTVTAWILGTQLV